MLLVDSVSIHNLKRSFPVTYKYLNEELESNFLFENFNSLYLATYTNLMASMAGIMQIKNDLLKLSDSEYKFFVKLNSTFHDFYPFIWKDFERELDYFTIINEDGSSESVFHFIRNGFNYNPSAIYHYSFWNRYDQLFLKKLCKNGVPAYVTMLNTLREFMDRLNNYGNDDIPYFFLPTGYIILIHLKYFQKDSISKQKIYFKNLKVKDGLTILYLLLCLIMGLSLVMCLTYKD